MLTRWLKLTVYVHNHTKGFNSDMWARSRRDITEMYARCMRHNNKSE